MRKTNPRNNEMFTSSNRGVRVLTRRTRVSQGKKKHKKARVHWCNSIVFIASYCQLWNSIALPLLSPAPISVGGTHPRVLRPTYPAKRERNILSFYNFISFAGIFQKCVCLHYTRRHKVESIHVFRTLG